MCTRGNYCALGYPGHDAHDPHSNPPPEGSNQTRGLDVTPLYPPLPNDPPRLHQAFGPPQDIPVQTPLQRWQSDPSAMHQAEYQENAIPTGPPRRTTSCLADAAIRGHYQATLDPFPPAPVAQAGVDQQRKRALIVGCNYPNDPSDQLHSCVNDALRMYDALTQRFGYDRQNVRLLVDDDRLGAPPPTRQNIIVSMKWLVADARDGDRLFFHFSGHGTCSPDYTGDEKRKENQCLMPTDYRHAGLLVDDDINQILVRPLPEGCTLHALMDCCHSGTVMDLQFFAKDGRWKNNGNTKYYKGSCGGHVFQFSACKDGQSAYGSENQFNAAGAATCSFINALMASPPNTYAQIIYLLGHQVGQFAEEHQSKSSPQTPQLTSNTDTVNLNAFVII